MEYTLGQINGNGSSMHFGLLPSKTDPRPDEQRLRPLGAETTGESVPRDDEGCRSSAGTVEWPSARFRGADRPTHRLVVVGSSVLEFRQTHSVVLGGILFLAFGLGVMGLSAFKYAAGSGWLAAISLALVALLFTLIGLGLLIGRNLAIVFDKRSGLCWHGRRAYQKGTKGHSPRHWVKMDDISEIELVPRYYWSGSGDGGGGETLYAFELVLRTGRRIRLLNYVDRQNALTDARVVCAFMGRPLSDLTNARAIDAEG